METVLALDDFIVVVHEVPGNVGSQNTACAIGEEYHAGEDVVEVEAVLE